jgi:hypothetical protein
MLPARCCHLVAALLGLFLCEQVQQNLVSSLIPRRMTFGLGDELAISR